MCATLADHIIEAVKIGSITRWRANFVAGLAVVLPAFISVAVIVWLFGTLARFTDLLLIFVPRTWTHQDAGSGPLYWYSSVWAFILAMILICGIGLFARYYLGKKIIQWVDTVLLQIPLLNKVYAATKQVNDAFSTGKKTSFRTVVSVEFPYPGIYSVGFVTNDGFDDASLPPGRKMMTVFIPTTPNPTSGFLVQLPEEKVTKLQMSVADGIKYIISLGAIVPDQISNGTSGGNPLGGTLPVPNQQLSTPAPLPMPRPGAASAPHTPTEHA